MTEGLVTVAVPIYNTERYLDRCIQSIVSQTYWNLEILLIDDGSPDRCPEICDHWARQDSRIRVIHKENAGLGMARNTALKNANGEYICFVDSDDFLSPETVARAYALAKAERADVVAYGMADVDAAGGIMARRIPRLPQQIYRGNQVREIFLPALMGPAPDTGKYCGLFRSLCGGLFSMVRIREIGWQIPSEREIISEDSYALLDLYGFADTVAVLPEALYFYFCENPKSLTHTHRRDRFEKIKILYHACTALCRERNYPAEVARRCGDLLLDLTIGAMKQATMEELRQILEDSLFQQLLGRKREDKLGFQKRCLFWAAARKHVFLCCLLLDAKKATSGRA